MNERNIKINIFLVTVYGFSILIASSCSSLIGRYHAQMNSDYGIVEPDKLEKKSPFQMIQRQNKASRENSIGTHYNGLNGEDSSASNPNSKKRYQADDFTDSKNSASLWAGDGKENYLFSEEQQFDVGDIVLLEVMAKLNSEMVAELKRVFPEPKNRAIASGDKTGSKGAPPEAPKEAEEPDDKNPAGSGQKVYDKVSSVIVEQITKEHVLIRGRKQMIFRNKKRVLEVKGLVARRDIDVNGKVRSDDLMEQSIQVIQ